MAKVRVYELAKEVSLDSKELVEKLLAGGMDIKNYMSTLDDEEVVRAREIVAGRVSEVVEEKRVHATVIRRRKKIVTLEADEEGPEEAAEAEAAEGGELGPVPQAEEKLEEQALPPEGAAEVPPEQPVAAAAAAAGGETLAPPPEQVAEAEVPAEGPVPDAASEVKPKKKKGRKKKGDEPARIVKKAEEGPLRHILTRETPEKREPVLPPVGPKPPSRKPMEIMQEVVRAADQTDQKALPKKKRGRGKGKADDEPSKAAVRRRRKEIVEHAELYQDRVPRRRGKRGLERAREGARNLRQTEITVPKAIKRRIRVQGTVTVSELAKAMGIKANELLKALFKMGLTANLNHPVDFETASVVADEWGYELELATFAEQELIAEPEDRPEELEPRPPVVTIMGHVDHGKTSLLDYIRQSNVTGGESGGITQHIGAYFVKIDKGDIVFLDTPGHEAFTAMRARGARVTDIIVLVVAADDGVMPQTREAVNHARAAGIPIVVAVNKIDKPQASPDKVKRELAELDLAPEDWGGETLFGSVSALTGEGVDDLLGLILLQAEMLELKGNPNRPARGTIIEAKLDKSRGPVATVLIRNGSLKPGDYFICGLQYGRIRAMNDHKGVRMSVAGPSHPVEIYGISGVPMAGDEFVVLENEKTAKEIVSHREALSRKQEIADRSIVSLEDLYDRIKEGEVKELNIVLKADVQGSIEALSDALAKLGTGEVKLRIIHSGTGAITESDVMLASASQAIIIGFNVRANPRVSEVAEKEKIDIRYYDVIYNVLKDVRSAMSGLLEPVYKEEVIGRAEIREIFHIPKIGAVAGCQVSSGKVERNARVRVLREEVVVFDGKVASLRRFKEDVKEVQTGFECGIGIENFQDVKPGDIFEVYRVEQVKAEL